jgi:GH15 family glucan-1,4-alpha-glucosidase
MYPYGLVGNCQILALVDDHARVAWLSLPRPDAPPVFGRMLDGDGGTFAVEALERVRSSQSYRPNTNVLVTRVEAQDGAFDVIDFCPRFYRNGTIYRPAALARIVRPVSGTPQVRVRLEPVDGWSKKKVAVEQGHGFLQFPVDGDFARVTTNAPITLVADQSAFSLDRPLHFLLTQAHRCEEDVATVVEDGLRRTEDYWRTWVKHCSIPSRYQRETIRSALALKLHVYEETGAILAAATTSLPEYPGEVRNWDYRLCWLRDSYYTLSALHRLGHFEEMEGFVRFLLGIVRTDATGDEPLPPVYRLDRSLPLPECIHDAWGGYADSRPVRSGNAAAMQLQHDVYGELVLALAPIFLDERFEHLRTAENARLLAVLGRRCADTIGKIDAGLWELRDGDQEHSFTNLMNWVGLNRLEKIRQHRSFPDEVALPDPGEALAHAESRLRAAVVDGTLRNGPTDRSHNAALLQLPVLRFPDRELCLRTVDAIREDLRVGNAARDRHFLFRYRRSDDFGVPKIPFVFCSFWLAEALGRLGRVDEAMEVLDAVKVAANPLGLYSEHFDPATGKQWGNFPQAYSHVGQILAAFAASPDWSEVL